MNVRYAPQYLPSAHIRVVVTAVGGEIYDGWIVAWAPDPDVDGELLAVVWRDGKPSAAPVDRADTVHLG